MTAVRALFHDFEEGAVGAAFAPVAMYGGAEEVYSGNPPPTATTPQYSSVAASGSRSLHFPAWEGGSDFYWSWYAPSGPVCGIEYTFKVAPSPGSGQILVGGELMGLEFFANESGLTFFNAPDPAGPFGPTSIPLDMAQWFAVKVLPTGEWSFGYAGGAAVLSGPGTPVAPPYSDQPHAYQSQAQISTQWAGQYPGPGAVTPLWIDDVVFWLDPDGTPPPPDEPATQFSAPPRRRVYPRDDYTARRTAPASVAQQHSNRVVGGYL